MNARIIKRTTQVAHRGGKIAGRVGTGTGFCLAGGLGGLLVGMVAGAFDITKELVPESWKNAMGNLAEGESQPQQLAAGPGGSPDPHGQEPLPAAYQPRSAPAIWTPADLPAAPAFHTPTLVGTDNGHGE